MSIEYLAFGHGRPPTKEEVLLAVARAEKQFTRAKVRPSKSRRKTHAKRHEALT